MKTNYLFSLLVVVALVLTGCKNDSKKDTTTEDSTTETSAEETTTLLKADEGSAMLKWTAYKTTDKVGVPGEVDNLELTNLNEGSTPEEILSGSSFKLNLMEFSTGDEGRDKTLVESFFSKLTQPEKVTGKLVENDGDWHIELTFNGVTVKKLPAKVAVNDGTATVKTTIELKDFKALDALASLQEACYDLHKGEDGESKTWEMVDVSASIHFDTVE